MNNEVNYSEKDIKTLEPLEHIRHRPGMYIGKTGDGSSPDDGIYILVKEILDNSIDEYIMGYGKKIEINITSHDVKIRDYGRGIPLNKMTDAVSIMNTSGKFDSQAFKKSVGLNGVGSKAVNALSSIFKIKTTRDKVTKSATFNQGKLVEESDQKTSSSSNGTEVWFQPDNKIFINYRFVADYLHDLLWNYAYLNSGLKIIFNNQEFYSKNGLKDLIDRKINPEFQLYNSIHLKNEDIEVSFTHSNKYAEEYYSFVNGQYTIQGGTHLNAFKESIVKTVREFYKKDFDASDIRMGIVASIVVRIQEPLFESQTKTKLGTEKLHNENITMRSFVGEFIRQQLDNFLHKNPLIADNILKKIQSNERERKDMEGVRKIAKERAKKANIHNRKLRDCRYHYTDLKYKDKDLTMLFITEGDSASGSITKARNAEYQAVFSLKGKPLNCFKNNKKKIVYENEEFNLLQHALNIEEGLENLRYNQIIIATDADNDGMHIRMLLLTFFLQFFPDLVRLGHVKILETPLFRVRNKKDTIYCFSEEERKNALIKLGNNAEITRFKGLGEISPDEFKDFIDENIKLVPVLMNDNTKIHNMLEYFMGDNNEDRKNFIINNLIVETNKENLLENS